MSSSRSLATSAVDRASRPRPLGVRAVVRQALPDLLRPVLRVLAPPILRLSARLAARDRLRHVLLVSLVLAAQLAHGADYVREKKWADEITPGLVVGDPLYLEGPNGHRFLTLHTGAGNARAGLVIAHGIGVHPDWGLIGTLRSSLADQGYTTLSVQMPVLAAEAKPEEYPATFDEAAERLRIALDALRAQGHQKLALVSHSMGSRMVRAYLTKNPGTQAAAWVCIGLGGTEDFSGLRLPVLDLYGEHDLPAVLDAAKRRAPSLTASPRSRRVVVPGADHFFNNQGPALVKQVKDFLDTSL
jgi:pimeloyl-ACP methyl ester carboxylesterase